MCAHARRTVGRILRRACEIFDAGAKIAREMLGRMKAVHLPQQRTHGCEGCTGDDADFDLRMAFQPIVNTTTRSLFAQEALVRGPNREPAGEILAKVNDSNRYRFDQACRVAAVKLAARLDVQSLLSINFMPNAVYEPERCLRTTVETAAAVGFPLERIIFEFSESEQVTDTGFLRFIVEHYEARGLRTAIDDFGAGYSGLNLLAELQPDIVKLDMGLCRGIDHERPRRSIVRGIAQFCRELEIQLVAEGIETRDEARCLQDLGIELFQGYYFAKPAFEAQPEVTFDA